MQKILLVFGDSELSNTMAQLCIARGIQPDEVTSLAASLERLDENNYSLIVCQPELADGSATRLVVRAKAVGPQIKIISFSRDTDDRQILWSCGCNDVVLPENLEKAVNKALDKLE